MVTTLRRDGGTKRLRVRRAAAMTGTAVLALGAALTTPATAAPAHTGPGPAASPADDTVAFHQQAVTDAEQQAVLDYWTPERMAALTTPTSGNPPLSSPDGAPWTADNALPRTVGRLFFTDHGEDVSCTATVVDSANRSTVVTAAHCVDSTDLLGEDNQWAANEMFVPGYHDGQAPYGKFVGRAAVADTTWLENDAQDSARFHAHDQAFEVLNTNEQGEHVQDAVQGAQKIGFDQPGNTRMYAFGYPRAANDPAREGLPEYTGERLAYCNGTGREYPGTSDSPESKDQWGTACIMGGGSSGGPRMTGFDPATGQGTVVGDITHAGWFDGDTPCSIGSHDGCVRYMVGPQFTTAVTAPLYERAQHTE